VVVERIGGELAGEITADDLEAFVGVLSMSPVSRRGLLLTLRVLFAWGLRRGFVASNPGAAVDVPVVPPAAPVVHPPAMVGEVLRIAFAWDLTLGRALAIRYFAGLRRSEVERIGESDIGAEFITVPARAAKTRARRVVRIQPALAAFLALGGELPLATANRRWTLLSHRLPPAARGHNGPRHSFCSYHLAAFKSASLTALEAGHTEAVLFGTYRELVSESDAWAFWGLRP
jgi:integrase